ncbi:glycosyltransferase family 4 protein [Croceicoccus mobilis]|uniref:Glycosyltransferase group 1 protein n=1 Tax=Croceicoccus mobilis TaxID=1703339 RepID=A0A916YY04_9SPHN|nr:glycosyltransferase family 4 protein [Croceicoccus mobilis]GGD66384.1 glycosyltransferase group 1 protein [Croceicoccus mobilis]
MDVLDQRSRLQQYDEAVLKTGPDAVRHAGASKINVFVHLASDKDAARWKAAYDAGTLVGVNDETPYGYGRAVDMGCNVTFSTSHAESLAAKVVRLALRVITGFDYIHARRQWAAMRDADVVWTHTESQTLAVAAVFQRRGLQKGKRPMLVGQTVWLCDQWSRMGFWRRALARKLMPYVDVLSFLSPHNRSLAERLFPGTRCEFIPFGIPAEKFEKPRMRSDAPLKILAVGNDRHRDWRTLVDAVIDRPEYALTILSATAPASLAAGHDNVEIHQARSNDELRRHFAEAGVVCVPLSPNFHASGITVMEEAALAGVPMVATDTGGLDAYFGQDCAHYVPVGDARAMADAFARIAADPQGARDMARRAQSRMLSGAIDADSYIRRHVELSEALIAPAATG